MKKITRLFVLAVIITAVTISYVSISCAAEETTGLEVTELVIARDVVEREPIDAGVKFSADVHQLYCFSRVKVDIEAATIFHSWYFNDEKVLQVELNVKKSPGFRTYSNKTIMASQKGVWEVEVQDTEGNILKSVKFTIE